ncbi:efflux RND transporter periplasmic adaptor subunit [Salinisphaera sp. T31B1]|uniref:efflux RND transporter periplasmic adaptor subunit n=1 Tax=Salinisphaera sp. T31B1 TaxID=727963 RepID=UPI003340D319
MSRRYGLIGLIVGGLIVLALWRLTGGPAVPPDDAEATIAVQTTAVLRTAVEDVREFAGTLEASAVLTVAPKIAGQVQAVNVDIGDPVERGDTLVALDDEEYRQALAEAQAQLEVAQAQLAQARGDAATANRTLGRVRSLNDKGIAATAELDAAQAEATNARAAVAVASAGISQARAQVETARVRLGYTDIRAVWPGETSPRVVGQRMVEPGDTVAANTALMRVVAIDPLTAIIQVPEDLFTSLRVGQEARLRVAGAAEADFTARITRIAPVFDPQTRRARVELRVDNADAHLAPGMFVQVGLVAQRLVDAPVVPRSALVTRDGRRGVFRVDAGADGPLRARFVAVTVAFEAGQRAAIAAPADLDGDVVTLGQAQLEDGIAISAQADDNSRPAARSNPARETDRAS